MEVKNQIILNFHVHFALRVRKLIGLSICPNYSNKKNFCQDFFNSKFSYKLNLKLLLLNPQTYT